MNWPDLKRAADRLSVREHFLGTHLRRLEMLHAGSPGENLSHHLQLDEERRARLSLCRTPRRTDAFAADITAISDYVVVDPKALANCVRTVWGLEALKEASSDGEKRARLLAAARSVEEAAVTGKETQQHGALRPAWIDDAVEFILGRNDDWDAGPRFPRDLELAVVLHLPLAIIELPELTGDTVVNWLRNYGIELEVYTPPKDLRGALVANAGSGLLFVSADDPRDERRLTIAHEAAHFALDYWAPRQRIANQAPHLLDVVDGLRPLNEDAVVDGLLARVHLGPQTHLFERDQGGKVLNLSVIGSEERATLAAWELLAPQECVWARANSRNTFVLTRLLEDEFGLPRSAAREYSAFLHRTRSKAGHERFRFDDD